MHLTRLLGKAAAEPRQEGENHAARPSKQAGGGEGEGSDRAVVFVKAAGARS